MDLPKEIIQVQQVLNFTFFGVELHFFGVELRFFTVELHLLTVELHLKN